jgi:hypothetical protein
MSVTRLDDRTVTQQRPWSLKHAVEFRDRRAKWSITGDARRDARRNIPHIPADHTSGTPLTEDQFNGAATLKQLFEACVGRIHDLGMLFVSDKGYLVEQSYALLSTIQGLHERKAALQLKSANFDLVNPEIVAPPPINRPNLTPKERVDTSGGYDTSAAASSRAAKEHERRINERRDSSKRISEELEGIDQAIAEASATVKARRAEILDVHRQYCEDAERHRAFAREIMSMYWSTNARIRNVWWRRLCRRLIRKPSLPIPTWAPPAFTLTTWETQNAVGEFEQIETIIQKLMPPHTMEAFRDATSEGHVA